MKRIISITILILAFCLIAFSQTSENICPEINFSGKEYDSNNITIYTLEISKDAKKYDLKYNWIVKGGKVISGQNTKVITFLREENHTVITFEIEGLPKGCKKVFTGSKYIDPKIPTKIDWYNKISEIEEKKSIDNWLIGFSNDPSATGLIKLQDDADLIEHIRMFNSYLDLKGFDKTRLLFGITKKAENKTEIWIIHKGAEIKDCNCDDCLIIKSEDFDKLIKIFRPKTIIKKRKK